jgi:hypothetical protein
MTKIAWLLVAVPLLGGCYSVQQPSFHPGDARDILVAIARRGVTVSESIAGESACDDPGLVGNAIHLVATVPSDPTPRDIYLYVFRERGWAASEDPVDACQAAYHALDPGAKITRIDVPTYRVFGADWSDELVRAVREGLAEASQEGE